MVKISLAVGLRNLFAVLGALELAICLYCLFTDGSPFTKELLAPWFLATLIDVYINFLPLVLWIAYKESNWISTILLIILLVPLGSIVTSTYIVVQFFKLSPQESSQDPIYYVLLRHSHRNGAAPKTEHSSAVSLRIIFSILGFVMVGTLVYTLVTAGSPFRLELLTPWLAATLTDFYCNVTALAVWVAYKESRWISAVFWIILLICFGSITTCIYIVWELFKIPCHDPAYLILVRRGDRAGSKYNELSEEAT